MKYEAVRKKSTHGLGAVHKRTLEPLTSAVRAYAAGEVLCNHHWGPADIEDAPSSLVNCQNCEKREEEILAAK